MKLESYELSILSDILANCHDWPVEELQQAVVDSMVTEVPSLDRKVADSLYRQFEAVPAEERFKGSFDHQGFIVRVIQSDSAH